METRAEKCTLADVIERRATYDYFGVNEDGETLDSQGCSDSSDFYDYYCNNCWENWETWDEVKTHLKEPANG
jgi:hypothetical protein